MAAMNEPRVKAELKEIKPTKLTDDFIIALWDEQRGEWRPSEEMVLWVEEENDSDDNV